MRRVDVPGLVLLVVGVAALQFVLDRGQREDWFASSLIVWLSVVAAVALVALVVRELRADGAGGRPARAAPPDVRGGARPPMFVISIAFYGIMVLSPLFTQILMGYTAMLAGLVLAPGGLSTLDHDADRRRPPEPHRPALDHRDGLRDERLRHVPDGHAHAGGELLARSCCRASSRGSASGSRSCRCRRWRSAPSRCASWATPRGSSTSSRTIGGSIGIATMATLLERGAQVAPGAAGAAT